jgi:hypothetical protein
MPRSRRRLVDELEALDDMDLAGMRGAVAVDE